LAAFFVFVVISAVAANKHHARFENYCIEQAQEIAREYGIGFEKIDITHHTQLSGCYQADYYFSGMKNLSYGEMYELASHLDCLKAPYGNDSFLVFMKLIYSDGDKYLIYTTTRSIYLNDMLVDNDFVNTEYYKEHYADKNNSSKALGATNHSSSKSNSTSAPDNDPYNAKSYSNPDDFYYDNYYSFSDYYDAEGYWYDHRN